MQKANITPETQSLISHWFAVYKQDDLLISNCQKYMDVENLCKSIDDIARKERREFNKKRINGEPIDRDLYRSNKTLYDKYSTALEEIYLLMMEICISCLNEIDELLGERDMSILEI